MATQDRALLMSILRWGVVGLISVLLIGTRHRVPAANAQPPSLSRWVVYLPQLERSGCAPRQLVADGGFEAGLPSGSWLSQSNVNSDILDDTAPPAAHSGQWKAWLGGDDRLQESLWQELEVPADATLLVLSYWWRVDTLEPTHPFDTLQVQLRDQTGRPVEILETLTDGDAAPRWRQSQWELSGYAGRKLQLAFVAQTDDTGPTSFFIDDVSLLAACSKR